MDKFTLETEGSMPWNQMHITQALAEYAKKHFKEELWKGGEVVVRAGVEDKLDRIFRLQSQLVAKYKMPRLSDLEKKYNQTLIRNINQYIVEELFEAMSLLKNKPWRKTFTAVDTHKFYEELADALHFFIELCIVVSLDSCTLFDYYIRKHTVNVEREGGKY